MMTKDQLLTEWTDRINLRLVRESPTENKPPRCSVRQMRAAYEELWPLIFSTTVRDGRLQLFGAGRFIKKERPARKGRNPRTGATIEIPATNVLQFLPAQSVREQYLGQRQRADNRSARTERAQATRPAARSSSRTSASTTTRSRR